MIATIAICQVILVSAVLIYGGIKELSRLGDEEVEVVRRKRKS